MAERPLDETILEGLRLLQPEGKPDMRSMLIALYLDTAPGMLKELEKAAPVGDTALLHTASHKLNAASAVIGALRLSARCKELEALARQGSVIDASERVAAITREYRLVEAALRLWCTARS